MAARFYRFRDFTPADLPLAERWLRTPEVARWWGDAEEQLVSLRGHLTDASIRQWIVEHGDRPFAYVQAYPVQDWPQPHLMDLPPGAQAVDAFIGEPDMIGCGHGSAFLGQLARMLVEEGAPLVSIDPHPQNERARRAYERAGFVGDEIFDTVEGPVVLMLFTG